MKIIHLVSNKVWGGGELYVLDLAIAAQEMKAAHELLRDGERCLPNGVGWIQLPEAPFDDICHLQRIG